VDEHMSLYCTVSPSTVMYSTVLELLAQRLSGACSLLCPWLESRADVVWKQGLGPAPIPVQHLSAHRLAAALVQLLQPSVQHRAKDMQLRLLQSECPPLS